MERNKLCKICNEMDDTKFYSGRPNKCKICICKDINLKKNGLKPLDENLLIDDINIWDYFEPGTEKWLHDYIRNEVIPDIDRQILNIRSEKNRKNNI